MMQNNDAVKLHSANLMEAINSSNAGRKASKPHKCPYCPNKTLSSRASVVQHCSRKHKEESIQKRSHQAEAEIDIHEQSTLPIPEPESPIMKSNPAKPAPASLRTSTIGWAKTTKNLSTWRKENAAEPTSAHAFVKLERLSLIDLPVNKVPENPQQSKVEVNPDGQYNGKIKTQFFLYGATSVFFVYILICILVKLFFK